MSRHPLLIALTAAIVGLSVGIATLTTAAPPTPSPTRVVGYLGVQGVEGEVIQDGFLGTLEVRSFDFLVTRAGGGSGGGGGAGKPNFRDFDVVVLADKASPILLKKLTLGTNIPKVELFLASNSPKIPVYRTYTMRDATLTSLREYDSGQGDDLPMEELSFDYKRINVESTSQDPQGGTPDVVSFCWIVPMNKVCPS